MAICYNTPSLRWSWDWTIVQRSQQLIIAHEVFLRCRLVVQDPLFPGFNNLPKLFFCLGQGILFHKSLDIARRPPANDPVIGVRQPSLLPTLTRSAEDTRKKGDGS